MSSFFNKPIIRPVARRMLEGRGEGVMKKKKKNSERFRRNKSSAAHTFHPMKCYNFRQPLFLDIVVELLSMRIICTT